ncbi:MAG: hypothetical protein R3E75_02125 [Steroidobacteraceae bacterium]|nr:hypothetical protein [Nevskiaceae bacterium]MCP5338934.1 hypothetical protein [Nevskiaceae bacterium]MCP5359653.1 hypothetical protein [Nevskiaceae bacterium]
MAVAIAAALASGSAAAATAAVAAPSDKLPVTHVRDLSYGDALFYFYQGESFEALTRLGAYSEWGRVPSHEAEAQLLLGGLYLELGLHNEAGERFEKLLTQDVPLAVRNRAWFYLAKVWYVRGYDQRAEETVRRLAGQLPPVLESERMHLLSNVLMRQGRFAEAAAVLDGWQGPQDWAAFARFNLGAALIRDNQLHAGARYLDAVGMLQTRDPELLALRDRANLTLGIAYLQASEPANAKSVLQRVRLDGSYANRALLGVGWAEAELNDPRAALTPWLELRDRNLRDAAVQEAWLAVPYAFTKLEAPAQAAEYYEAAVLAFAEERTRIEQSIERIRGGGLLDGILEKEAAGGSYGWFWQLKDLPDAPESRYLYEVLASHDFQEGLKNYRDLVYLEQMLARWSSDFDAYRSMIDTRQQAFAERLPRADELLARGSAETLGQQRDAIESRLNAVDAARDVAALGSAEQRDQWARILRAEQALEEAPHDEQTEALRERLRLVKGALYWRLDENYRAAMFGQRRALREVDGLLRETQDSWQRLGRARASVPTNTAEFGVRVDAARQRLEAIQQRLAAAKLHQNQYLAEVAIQALDAQKQRLGTYQVQARFALAAIYDRAAMPAPREAGQSGSAAVDAGPRTVEPAAAAPIEGGAP